MKYKIVDIPITKEFIETNDTLHCTTEQAVRVESPSAFSVVVRRVNVSYGTHFASTPLVVKFSESQYAIPNATHLKLRTAAYYRDWEESDGSGIGDSEEATLRRDTDFATFQREAGQTPLTGAHHVQVSTIYTSECWVLCTSIAPTSQMGMNCLNESVWRGYDAATLIADPTQFAKQLGIDFGNTLSLSDLEGPGKVLWMSRPVVLVGHGPVVYAESPSDLIESFPKESWGLIALFVKRIRFSNQKEYRFAISIGGLREPKERTFDILVTRELRDLCRLVEWD